MKKFDIVCFGSTVVDTFVSAKISERGRSFVIPHGSKILIKDLRFENGGGGTNTAVAFSRLGFKTGYVGKIGNDRNGQSVMDLLKREKIKFLGKRVNEPTSGFSIILRSKEKHRSILTYKGINDNILEEDVRRFKTRWLYISSLMGKSLKTQISLVRKMKRQGTKIAYNPSE